MFSHKSLRDVLAYEYKSLEARNDEHSQDSQSEVDLVPRNDLASRLTCSFTTILIIGLFISNVVSILFALHFLYLGKDDQLSAKSVRSFETGFDTDLAAARSQISIKRLKFTGGPTFDADGFEYLQFPLNTPRYIGTPSEEIDDAWNSLTSARYIFLSEGEARDAWGPKYMEFYDVQQEGYIAGFETFHLLHCLDHIRQSFYPERYTHEGIHGTLHRDHCIDALRQMLQCTVDMTPIPTRYYAGIGQSYIDADQEHTCRDFGKIRKWVTERFNGSLAVKISQHQLP